MRARQIYIYMYIYIYIYTYNMINKQTDIQTSSHAEINESTT